MIWVIGDVHGQAQHLNVLLDELKKTEFEKIILLGDYCDRGPDTKVVLDTVMALDVPKVCLMGNHEKLVLDVSITQDADIIQSWFVNGGASTLKSFGIENWEDIKQVVNGRYLPFLKGLKVVHQEQMELGGQQKSFVFMHAGWVPGFDLAQHQALNSFEAISKYQARVDVDWLDSPLWIRGEFLHGSPDMWPGHVVVHGHTPTQTLERYLDPMSMDIPRGVEAAFYEQYKYPNQPFVRVHPVTGKALSIDVDTGAGRGKALTAIGLSANNYSTTSNCMQVYCKQIPIVANPGPKFVQDFWLDLPL